MKKLGLKGLLGIVALGTFITGCGVMVEQPETEVVSENEIGKVYLAGDEVEFDTPMPVSVYGKSKLAGENYVRELNPKHLIVRSSWVYGTAKNDYFEFVDRMGSTGTTFEAPVDRVSTPTSARELAGFILSLIDKAEYGIFHASSEGTCSRYEYAREILALRGYDTALVKACRSREDGLVSSTHLENLMMKMTGLYEMPEWKDDLSRYVASLAPRAGKEDER